MKNNPLAVCHLANYAASFSGNFIASLKNLEKHLNNLGHKQIYVFYANTKDCKWYNEMKQNGKIVYLIKYRNMLGFMKLANIIKSNQVNIFHLHFTIPVITCFLLKLLFPRIKIIAHMHNLLSGVHGVESFSRIPKSRLKKILYNTFIIDLICCISGHVLNNLSDFGIRKNKCYQVDNGIDFSRLDSPANKYEEFENKNILMTYGTAFYTKGVDITIDSIKNIIKKYSIILMIICQNEKFVEQQIIKQLGILPSWIVIKPSKENIAEYYKNSALYLTPSREEGFSYAMLESIYCGTPVIRSDIPAMDRGLPRDMKVPVENPEALREKIEYFLNLPESARQSIAEEQKKYIIERWNIDIWSRKIIEMYNNIISF